VLAASILSNSQFSTRVPKRIKDMLSAESGCNDGISFPFLFIGLALLKNRTVGGAMKEWFLITILWQCVFGTVTGFVIGVTANKILRFSTNRRFIDPPGFVVFYLLAALLCVGVGSTLGTDDFLVAFGAGYGFARDGWFTEKTKGVYLPNIIDLLLNSTMFVYLGTIIPWYAFHPQPIAEWITPWRVILFVMLVLLFRRIPIVLALYRWIPDIRTFREAIFCGHFGPMGLGGIFLAIEARAQLENGTSIPFKHPPHYGYPYTDREKAVETVWPLVCAIVFASTMVHGLSVFVMSAWSHLTRPKSERAKFFAAETDPLWGSTCTNGQEGNSTHVDTSCPLHRSVPCLRHVLTLLPITFSGT
jgi:NhaP-type Na+/H+ or K+/H+ antiporter